MRKTRQARIMSNQPQILHNADLTHLSSFRLPARAARLIVLQQPEELRHMSDDPPELVLGEGSNTLFLSDYPGTIVLNRLTGITHAAVDDNRVRVSVAAGENWHAVVRWCLDRHLYGLENLAMIPGSAGAAPMQNIGAYGMELSRRLEALDVWEWQAGQQRRLNAAECGLGYRTSRFREHDHGRFLITRIHLLLDRRPGLQTDYATLQAELARIGLHAPEPRQVAAAVMRIRRRRLPAPARVPNAGSFFKNPVVPTAIAQRLAEAFPDLPQWRAGGDRIKLSAAWMIDRLGWKGKAVGNVGVYARHALVLCNRGNATGAEVVTLMRSIQTSVYDAFGVELSPEPTLIGVP